MEVKDFMMTAQGIRFYIGPINIQLWLAKLMNSGATKRVGRSRLTINMTSMICKGMLPK